MPENWQSGCWLLMDAAGPKTVFGLVKSGAWLDYRSLETPFIEGGQSCVEGLLRNNGQELEELSGILYAAGPGSTLGLRLAAMFARSLLTLPNLRHWNCAQYSNLDLAAVSLIEDGETLPVQAIAPWRRDRIHRVLIRSVSPLDRTTDSPHPDDLESAAAWLFPLGNRPGNQPPDSRIREYPVNDIPHLLSRYPDLLKHCPAPTPFMAETPDFVRWSSKRHTAR